MKTCDIDALEIAAVALRDDLCRISLAEEVLAAESELRRLREVERRAKVVLDAIADLEHLRSALEARDGEKKPACKHPQIIIDTCATCGAFVGPQP